MAVLSHALLVAGFWAAPTWADDLHMRPRAAPITVAGEQAPDDLLWLKRGRRATFTVPAGSQLRLELFGIQKRQNGRWTRPGFVLLLHDGKRDSIELRSDVLSGTSIRGRDTWRLTRAAETIVSARDRTMKVKLVVPRGVAVGVALRAARLDDGAPAIPEPPEEPAIPEAGAHGPGEPAIPEPSPEPPIPVSLADEPPIPETANDSAEPQIPEPAHDPAEPQIPGPTPVVGARSPGVDDDGAPPIPSRSGGDEPAIPDPTLAAAAAADPEIPVPDPAEPDIPPPGALAGAGEPEIPIAASNEPARPEPRPVRTPSEASRGRSTEPEIPTGGAPPLAAMAMRILGGPPTVDVVEPDAVTVYHRVVVDAGLRLVVEGSGTVVLDVHAFRDPSRPETLEPVSLRVSVDDQVIESRSIDAKTNGRFQLLDSSSPLSGRSTLRLPLGEGPHGVTVQVADAPLGVLIRPTLADSTASEATLVAATAAPTRPAVITTVPVTPPAVESASRLSLSAGLFFPTSLPNVGGCVQASADYGFTFREQRFAAGVILGFARAQMLQRTPDSSAGAGATDVGTALNAVPIIAVLRWSLDPVDWLSLSAGAGAGAVVTWSETRGRDATIESDPQVAVTGLFEAGALFRLGPGGIVVRAQLLPASVVSTDNLTGFSPGGSGILTGYAIEL